MTSNSSNADLAVEVIVDRNEQLKWADPVTVEVIPLHWFNWADPIGHVGDVADGHVNGVGQPTQIGSLDGFDG